MLDKEIEKGIPVDLLLNPSAPEFNFSGNRLKLDVAFSLLHGTDGEDGSVQGLLQTMNIPSVGSGVLGSALSMNKIVAKQLLVQAGLPVGEFVHFTKAQRKEIKFQSIEKELKLPFMCKSASLGSSVGISKVKDETGFNKAVEDSFQYDDRSEERRVGKECRL